MRDLKRFIVLGGLAIAGLAATGYRVHEIKKIRKAIQEEQIIEIKPEEVEEVRENN